MLKTSWGLKKGTWDPIWGILLVNANKHSLWMKVYGCISVLGNARAPSFLEAASLHFWMLWLSSRIYFDSLAFWV